MSKILVAGNKTPDLPASGLLQATFVRSDGGSRSSFFVDVFWTVQAVQRCFQDFILLIGCMSMFDDVWMHLPIVKLFQPQGRTFVVPQGEMDMS